MHSYMHAYIHTHSLTHTYTCFWAGVGHGKGHSNHCQTQSHRLGWQWTRVENKRQEAHAHRGVWSRCWYFNLLCMMTWSYCVCMKNYKVVLEHYTPKQWVWINQFLNHRCCLAGQKHQQVAECTWQRHLRAGKIQARALQVDLKYFINDVHAKIYIYRLFMPHLQQGLKIDVCAARLPGRQVQSTHVCELLPSTGTARPPLASLSLSLSLCVCPSMHRNMN